MIGAYSFLVELLSWLVPLFFMAVGLGVLVKPPRKTPRLVGLFLAGFSLVMVLQMGVRYIHQVSNHRFLANLSTDDVVSVRVDETILADPAALRPIIQSLNGRQWFSSNHGGWADTVDLVITLRNGDVRRFWVGYYLRKPGAIIEFYRGSRSNYWADGYAFAPDLPRALAEAGVKLPKQP